MNIITSFFNKPIYNNSDETTSIIRNNEYNECLIKNMMFPYIKKIYLFIDNEYSLNVLNKLIENNDNKDKIVKIEHNKQALFSDYFKYIFDNLYNEVIAICNSDIYFHKYDQELINKFIIEKGNTFCLTRHETIDYKPLIDKRKGSYDVYIFKSPLNNGLINDSKFKQNLKGSDDMIVFLFQKYGYITLNPCLQIKIIHNHKSDFRETNYKRINNKHYFNDYEYKRANHCYLDVETEQITLI